MKNQESQPTRTHSAKNVDSLVDGERRSKIRGTHGNKDIPIIGASPAMDTVRKQIAQAAASRIPVLLMGETGTGKDLIAYTIHMQSDQTADPFIAVNLGSLPPELVSSELFGHERGSYTGATRRHEGVFERASAGTIFLDEIDSMDQRTQVSLLRILEDKKVTRLGGANRVKSTPRVIAATNSELTALVERGHFRKDLFYRLEAFRITVPPLRDRVEDIPLLVNHFLAGFSKNMSQVIHPPSEEVMTLLREFDWPGNVRELRNVIHRAVLLSDDGHISVSHLPERLAQSTAQNDMISFPLGTTLHDVERVVLHRTLDATNNNRKQAAELLGISRRAIYNKLHKHGIALKQGQSE